MVTERSRSGPPIVQFWDTEPPPEEVAELLASFERHNPEMTHLVFSRASAEAFIAERFSTREVTAFGDCAVPAMQADYLRYCAVLALGGIYADADYRSVGPLRPLLDGVEGGRLFGRKRVPDGWAPDLFSSRPRVGPFEFVTNNLFYFPQPGHPLLRLTLEIATTNIERRIVEDASVATGPCIFTSMYLLEQLGSFDAFIDHTSEGILAPTASLFCELVGSPNRIVEVLDGVRISALKESKGIVADVRELAYKSSDAHWDGWAERRGSIYNS